MPIPSGQHICKLSRDFRSQALEAKDTIEERILKLHANKRDLADALLEGTDDSSRLSYADMLALVQESGGSGASSG